MRVYKTPEIRNVAVVGHGASGKTSLVDALAFVAGTSKRHGAVKDGTALTDYTPDEIERKYSINLALAVAEWMDTKLNLIDTPGYLDFTGEALAGVYAADGAVVVVSATGGVEVGTEKVWDYCEGRGIPRLFFVSLMDKEHAGFERVYEQIKRQLTPKVIPVEIPVGEGDRKSTRLNSSHGYISYAVFCLKKKNDRGSTRNILLVFVPLVFASLAPLERFRHCRSLLHVFLNHLAAFSLATAMFPTAAEVH